MIEGLQEHMLTASFFNKIKPRTVERRKRRINDTPSPVKTCEYYEILEDDKLYWLYFILNNGYDVYNQTKRGFQVEKKHKFDIIEKVDKFKCHLKDFKLKASLLIEDLGTSNNINFTSFLSLCCMSHINLFVYKNKIGCFYNFNEDTSKYYVFDYVNKRLYKSPSEKASLDNKFILVSNLDKPLKAMSSYKKQDILEFATKLDINHYKVNSSKQKTKQELYNEILENI